VIVADNALISYLLIPGEQTSLAEHVRSADPQWVAPLLWISEFRNVVLKYLRAGDLGFDTAIRLMAVAEDMMRNRSFEVNSAEVLRLAEESGCSAYDCEYVALAVKRDLRLVTPDRQVLHAFPQHAVHPADFIT